MRRANAPAAAPSRRHVLARAIAWSVVLVAPAGCQRSAPGPSFRHTDITGADFARELVLTGHDGKPHALVDFKGKVVVVFFGFTQCPDICPTTLTEMAEVMKQLGPDADRVQVLFVTLDPERDTPELLARYVPTFDPRFLGLFGNEEATRKVAREFKVFYQKVPGIAPGSYSLDHTAGSYVFDTQGRVRLFVKHGQGPEVLMQDLRKLLS
jgi:protein SCO1/2